MYTMMTLCFLVFVHHHLDLVIHSVAWRMPFCGNCLNALLWRKLKTAKTLRKEISRLASVANMGSINRGSMNQGRGSYTTGAGGVNFSFDGDSRQRRYSDSPAAYDRQYHRSQVSPGVGRSSGVGRGGGGVGLRWRAELEEELVII